MAKIVKTRETEISLEEVVRLVKKNWKLLVAYLTCNFSSENKIIRLSTSLNLISVSNALARAEGLIATRDELEGAINQIFREIEHQKPHFKNMLIERSTVPNSKSNLDISFEIDISIAPVMPVDPLDIELDDQERTNPRMASPLTTAILHGRGNQDKVRHIGDGDRCGSVLDETDPEPIPEDDHL